MEVHASEHRLRIDRFLKKRLTDVGRGRILEWVRGGRVRVNSRPVNGENFFVKRGDRVEWPGDPFVYPGEAAHDGAEAVAGGLPGWDSDWPPAVLYEDPDLLIIHKPGGVPTNPSPAAGRRNVVSLLERTAGRLHLVHRLDRDTSGVLALARNPRARDRILTAFRARQVEKTYVAVVVGSVRASAGTLRARLLAHPRRSTRRVEAVRRGGVEARTDYRVAERFRGATRLEVRTHTGRMHQIRAQLAGMGHPILGDLIYGRPHSSRPPCLCLHARTLTLPHPRSGTTLAVEAPLPTRLAAFLERLRFDRTSLKSRGRRMEH